MHHVSSIDSRLSRKVLSSGVWNELRVLLAVHYSGSFHAAAEQIGLSQPTVSRAIRRLEDVTGKQLVVRTSGGVSLTGQGQHLARVAALWDATVETALTSIQGAGGEASGHVRVAITEGLCGCFAATTLHQYLEDYPDIDVTLRLPADRRDFSDNQCDIHVGFSRDSSDRLVSTRLGYLHLVPVVARSQLQSCASDDGRVFVHANYYDTDHAVWDRWKDAIQQGHIRVQTDSMFVYGTLVKAGCGIGLLGSYTLADPTLTLAPLECHVRLPMFLTTLRSRAEDPSVTVVSRWLSEIFGMNNPWFDEDLNTDVRATEYDTGYRHLFNLQ